MKIQYLDLSNNYIKEVKLLQDLKNLTKVNLSNNNIVHFPKELCTLNLIELDVSNN